MKTFYEWLELNEQFYNKHHLQNELNDLINQNVMRQYPHGGVHWVTIEDGVRNGTADVYIGSTDLPPELNAKLVPATKYYLQELGCRIGAERKHADHDDVVSIPILSYPRVRTTPGQWSKVDNPEAKRRLKDGRAIDVADLGVEVEKGVWKLNKFIDGVDYYDSKNNKWIWQIVQDQGTGEYFADLNTNGRDDEYKKVWIR